MPKLSISLFVISSFIFAVSCSSPKEEKSEIPIVKVESNESFSMPDLPLEMEFSGQKIYFENICTFLF